MFEVNLSRFISYFVLKMIWGDFMLFSAILEVFSSIFYFALHVVNTGAFPKALSEEEESALLRKMFEENDVSAKNKLIEHNLRLVAHIIKKYYSKGYDQDDLISVGTIGLIKGINTFKPDKNVKLATYASRCIENEILMFMRSSKKQALDVSLSDPIDTDKDGNSLTLVDIIADDVNIENEIETKMNIERLMKAVDKCLDERERSIIEYRYGLFGKEELPQREIAKKLNISRSYVSRIEKRAIEKLHDELQN